MAKGELDLKYKLAEFVKTQRKKKGYSQSELAKRALGADVKQTISAIENQRLNNIGLNTIESILEALDADMVFKAFD